MAITTNDIITEVNTYIGDSSTDRISANERLQAITEGTVWTLEEMGSDLQNFVFNFDYYDSVNYYKITTDIADLLEGADLRRDKTIHSKTFTHLSSASIAEKIGQASSESAWSIERRDNDCYVVINHPTRYSANLITGFDSLTDGGGEWTIDETTSDATNLSIDSNEFKQGSGCFNFDLDVSQSVNNRATLINSTLPDLDLSSIEDMSAFIFWAYIPDTAEFTSFTLFWGNDTSNYWSATVTTDIDGSVWQNGWNRVKVNWADATVTGTPTSTAVSYMRIDFNYGAGQTDDTDFRIDGLIIAKPERLYFHYLSHKVGTNSAGADIFKFGATNDIPYFSGKYDHLKFAVAHKASSVLFRTLRLMDMADREEVEAIKAIRRVAKFIPSSRRPITRNFKVGGLSFNK